MTAGVSGARLEPHEQAELMRIVLAGPDPADGLSAFTRKEWVDIPEED